MAEIVTEARLIEVGIELFGRHGPESVTTRAIAEAAGAQQSAISYHFGTKDRLYLACAEHIAGVVRSRIEPLLAAMASAKDSAEAQARIEALLSGLTSIMMSDDIAPMARFVVREQMNPTPAFELLYDNAMRHVVERSADLLNIIAGGRLTSEELRLRCMTLLGQVFAFRYARAALLRATAWEAIGQRETELVCQAVVANARAILADLAKDRTE